MKYDNKAMSMLKGKKKNKKKIEKQRSTWKENRWICKNLHKLIIFFFFFTNKITEIINTMIILSVKQIHMNYYQYQRRTNNIKIDQRYLQHSTLPKRYKKPCVLCGDRIL